MKTSMDSRNVPYNLIISSEIIFIFQMSFISDDASINKSFVDLLIFNISMIWFFSPIHSCHKLFQ